MKVSQEVIDHGLLAELAYLKLESSFFNEYSEEERFSKEAIENFFNDDNYIN